MGYIAQGKLEIGGRDVTTTRRPGEFTDGPMVDVKGMFQIPASRTIATLQVPYALAKQSRVYHAPVQWALTQIGKISTGVLTAGGVKPAGMHPEQGVTVKNGQWWGTGIGYDAVPNLNQAPSRSWMNLVIGPKQLWWKKLVTGEKPIARFTHPQFKKTYGVFLNIDGGYFTFTFKEAPETGWAAIAKWLTNLVATLIDVVQDVLGILKAVACPLGKSRLDLLSNYVGGKTHLLTESQRAQLMAAGLTWEEVKSLETGVTGSTAKALGQRVVDTVCGGPPDGGALVAKKTNWMLYAGIAGGALVLYLIFRRRR